LIHICDDWKEAAAVATRKPAKRPRKPAASKPRKQIARRPRHNRKLTHRAAAWLGRTLARAAKTHRDTKQARRDAAILRATHEGCTTCHGTGTVYTRDKKTGSFSGSKPCPAKPATTKVSRAAIARQSRFGVDRNSGLIGWRCPCGNREKPRYRDAKAATAALRSHERKQHGGVSVGGAWYAQLPESAKAISPAPAKTAS
jgi:hypothetical protein